MTMPERVPALDRPVAPKPRRAMFAAGRRLPALSAECAARQGGITSLAFECLGGRDAALRFLNEPHPGLGGRPLDVAMADTQGFDRVAETMRGITG